MKRKLNKIKAVELYDVTDDVIEVPSIYYKNNPGLGFVHRELTEEAIMGDEGFDTVYDHIKDAFHMIPTTNTFIN